MSNVVEPTYGICDNCQSPLEPVHFEEKEHEVINGVKRYTERVRNAVSHLVCPYCMKTFPVDDSFDGPWYRQNK